MKKSFLTLCLGLICAGSLAAQEREPSSSPYEFRLSVGAIPSTLSYSTFNNTYFYDQMYHTSSQVYAPSRVYYPAINAYYGVRYKRWFTLNFAASYSGNHTRHYDLYNDAHLYTERETNLSLLTSAQFNWYNNSWMQLYSTVGIGLTLGINNNFNAIEGNNIFSTYFAGQLVPFGISVGQQLFLFAEVGVGAMGAIQGGVGYRF